MKLIDYTHYEDFGHEWYFQLLTIPRRFALIDVCIQWDEYAGNFLPFLIISIGPRAVGFSFRWWKFELRFDMLDFQPRDLERYRYYKEGDYR